MWMDRFRGWRCVRVSGVTAAAILFAACQRVPEEPPPSPSARVPGADNVGRPTESGSRCVQSTPSVAPPPPAPGPAPGCPADPDPPGSPAPKVTISFPDVSGKPEVQAEVARTIAEHARGLMYRRSLPDDGAMFFAMGVRRVHEFWMRNTCIPLDMLFIDDDGFIVGIVENVPTLSDQNRYVDCPSRFVLEVNAGWSRRHGVRAGHHVTIPEGLH